MNLEQVAIHEAGHIVMAQSLGRVIEWVTVTPDSGDVHYTADDGPAYLLLEDARVTCGGIAAESLNGDVTASDDRLTAYLLIVEYLEYYGLPEERADGLLADALSDVTVYLRDNWQTVKAIAAALAIAGSMTGAGVEAIIAGGRNEQ